MSAMIEWSAQESPALHPARGRRGVQLSGNERAELTSYDSGMARSPRLARWPLLPPGAMAEADVVLELDRDKGAAPRPSHDRTDDHVRRSVIGT
jgi:hypothetical protein